MQAKNTKRLVYLNTFATLVSQMIQVLLGFLIRKIFIDKLGIVYLGYNSVFSNVLQMLNLADLGIGVAVTSFLYRPIVEKDEKRINALMFIYSKIYHLMGIIVAIVGIIILFFIPVIIPDAQCSDFFLRILFIINLIGTISTYFLAYKRTLLIAEQKSYLVTSVDSLFYLVCSIMQIIILMIWPNYILYLIINVLKNILANVILVFICNRQHKFINSNGIDLLIVEEYKKSILKYVKDLFVSRIGAYIYYGTDNIIISIFKGSLLAGYLSNYTMVTNLVNNVIVQILSSLQATYGQYIVSESQLNNQKCMTSNYAFTNFLAGNFCMVCILFMIQPFIELYFGEEYVLGNEIVVLLAINFLLTIMLQIPSQIFVVYKLYHFDYPIVIFSAILNIIISVCLVQKMGVAGVLIGTLITSLLYLFSRYFIIAHFVFCSPYIEYLLKIAKYFSLTLITILLTFVFTKEIVVNTWILFIVKGISVALISVIVPLIFSIKSDELVFLVNKFIPSKFRKEKYYILCVLCVIVLIVICKMIGRGVCSG